MLAGSSNPFVAGDECPGSKFMVKLDFSPRILCCDDRKMFRNVVSVCVDELALIHGCRLAR